MTNNSLVAAFDHNGNIIDGSLDYPMYCCEFLAYEDVFYDMSYVLILIPKDQLLIKPGLAKDYVKLLKQSALPCEIVSEDNKFIEIAIAKEDLVYESHALAVHTAVRYTWSSAAQYIVSETMKHIGMGNDVWTSLQLAHLANPRLGNRLKGAYWKLTTIDDLIDRLVDLSYGRVEKEFSVSIPEAKKHISAKYRVYNSVQSAYSMPWQEYEAIEYLSYRSYSISEEDRSHFHRLHAENDKKVKTLFGIIFELYEQGRYNLVKELLSCPFIPEQEQLEHVFSIERNIIKNATNKSGSPYSWF